MKTNAAPLTLALLALLATGCAPTIAETRMAFHPPRPANCHIQVVEGGLHAMVSPEWAVVGQVSLADIDHPRSHRTWRALRARACAMGGHAVAPMHIGLTHNKITSIAGATFLVLRARTITQPGGAHVVVPHPAAVPSAALHPAGSHPSAAAQVGVQVGVRVGPAQSTASGQPVSGAPLIPQK